MKSSQEMRDEFIQQGMPPAMIDEAFRNSLKIANMSDVNLDDKSYKLPVFPVPPEFNDDEGAYLHYLVMMGLSWRFSGREDDPILLKRIERELGIIRDMGFNTYFLIVWDLCEFAREADIWWNVRGSGAGSLVAYCLGITNIDPIQNSLLFERFLNPGRVSMPDIDLDYPDDRRGEMIAYAADKYGKDKVAAIITFGTMGAKAAVKDVGRALGVDLAKINRATSLIPQEARQKTIREYIELNTELQDYYNQDAEIKRVMDTAIRLQGLTRHASTHAAGVIIADKPLDGYTPLHRITGKDPSGGSLTAVTQFPMETAESIGLLKVDFLGLSTLTILRKACDLINKHHGTHYTMDNVPYRHDDLVNPLSDEDVQRLDAAFKMMGRGETVGVFQVESSGMQSMLRGMRPQKFEHIIAGISLYRPGPMDLIPTFNRRLHGEEETEYIHPKLENILKETFAIIVYQEQIMQIAGQLFGYELGEADLIRKAVSKKKEKELAKHRETFLERGPENGVDVEKAQKIFEDIMFFANYGFNKAHASDYAVITVQTAFLKCHYPAEYMTALLSVQFDNSEKVATFLEECRRLKIPVLPPHINYSAVDFDIEEHQGLRGIRFGMGAIKNAGVAALQHIIDEREQNGRFDSLSDFTHRVDLKQVGKRTVESLIKVGAFDPDWGARDDLLYALERIVGYSADYHQAQSVGQMSLFGEAMGMTENDVLEIPCAPRNHRFTNRQQLGWEKELMGLYVTGRPVDKHVDKFRAMGNTNEVALLKDPTISKPTGQLRIAGEVVAIRRITTKKGDPMAIMTIEDWHESASTIEAVMFTDAWLDIKVEVKRHKRQKAEANSDPIDDDQRFELEEGDILVAYGKYDERRGEIQLLCNKVSFEFETLTATDIQETMQVSSPHTWMDGMGTDGLLPQAITSNDEPPLPEFDDETGEVVNSQSAAVVPVDTPINAGFEADLSDSPAWATPVTPAQEDGAFDDLLGRLSRKRNNLHINVHFARTNETKRDRLRLRRIHTTLMAYPGDDHFSIVIEGGKKASVMDFPNHTTGLCEALLNDLKIIVGEENIVIKPLSQPISKQLS